MRMLLPLLFSTALLMPDIAHAEDAKSNENPHIYLWHFLRGCAPDARLQEAVRSAVKRLAYPVTALNPPQEWAGCQGEDCAKLLKQRCANGMASGAIVGGRGEQRGKWTVYSLWLHDLATGKTAYLDHYCPDCDLVEKIAASAPILVERPDWGPSARQAPSYCTAAAADSSDKPALPAVSKVHYIAFGEGRNKSAIQNAMEAVIKGTGMRAEPITVHAKDYNSPDVVARIVTKGQPEQVLVADVQQEGKVELFLYDARTQASDYAAVECPACDKDELLAKLRTAAGTLLDRCRGDQCGSRSTTTRAPAEVCQPFPACRGPSGTALALVESGQGTPLSSRQAQRNRIVTGIAWGGFAASAATAIALFALDQTSLSTVTTDGRAVDHVLSGPAWTATALSLVTLGIAIPVTALLDRGGTSSRTASSGSATRFQCPM